ncbi:MAG: hypothetical protein S4CHLAM7_04700 [Chlamydiae bacterium]|nr:hypothetical protein [Chlamydiota bacterium]
MKISPDKIISSLNESFVIHQKKPLGRPDWMPKPIDEKQLIPAKFTRLSHLLDRLNRIIHPPAMPPGFCGGPGAIFPGVFRADIKELQQHFQNVEMIDGYEQEAVSKINTLLNVFVPTYERLLDTKIYYSGEGNPITRYIDADGSEISYEIFQSIREKYVTALQEIRTDFLKMSTQIENLQRVVILPIWENTV